MTIVETIIPQLQHELSVTRKTLERIPNEKLGWKPHEKSMTFANLGSHLAEIPSWVVPTIAQASLDSSPVGGEPYKTPVRNSKEEILKEFDKNVAAAMEILPGVTDEDMLKPWSLLFAGSELFTMPRVAVLRGFVISHTIHHRAQLGLYLRLNDIAHPAMYGPSADEQG